MDYKEQWGYRCPHCRANFSINDNECSECGLDFKKYLSDKTIETFKNLIDKLPIRYITWSIWEPLTVLAIYLIVSIYLSDIINIYSQNNFINTIISFTTPLLILLLATLYIVKIKHRTELKQIGLSFKDYKFNIIQSIRYSFLFLVMLIINSKLLETLGIVFYRNLTVTDWIINSYSVKSKIVWLILSGIFLPVTEEIFYRGFLYKSVRVKFNFLQSSILISILYSLLYYDLNRIIMAFFMSLFFCLLFELYNSIFIPLLIHIILNFSYIIFSSSGFYIAAKIDWNFLVFLILIFFIVSIILEKFFINKQKKIFRLLYEPYNFSLLVLFIVLFFLWIIIMSGLLQNNNFFLNLKTIYYLNKDDYTSAKKLISNIEEDEKVFPIKQKILYCAGKHRLLVNLSKKYIRHFDDKKYNINIVLYDALSKAELQEDFTKELNIIKDYLNKNSNINKYELYEKLGWLYYKHGDKKNGIHLLDDSFNKIDRLSKISLGEYFYHKAYLSFEKNNIEQTRLFINKSLKYSENSFFADKNREMLKKINDPSFKTQ